jgi:alpha,alpha-trehalase
MCRSGDCRSELVAVQGLFQSVSQAVLILTPSFLQYEFDIAQAIEHVFGGELQVEEDFPLSPWPINLEAFSTHTPRERSTARPMTARHWADRAAVRKDRMTKLCWNEGQSMFFDYDTKLERQTRYESVTAFWPLWAGLATEDQALKLV